MLAFPLMIFARSIVIATDDETVRTWGSQKLHVSLGLHVDFVEPPAVFAPNFRRYACGVILDIRSFTNEELSWWLSSWRRVDPDWPVVWLMSPEQTKAALDGLDGGVWSYHLWQEGSEVLTGWAVAQVRNMLSSYFQQEAVSYAGLEVDVPKGTYSWAGVEGYITGGQAAILARLALAAGNPVSRDVLSRILAMDYINPENLLAYIYRLRSRIEDFTGGEMTVAIHKSNVALKLVKL